MRTVFILFVLPFVAFNQNSDDIIEQNIQSKYNLIYADYNSAVKQSISCFIGKPTVNTQLKGSGHAFYGNGNWQEATVLSKGVSYALQYFRYDIKNSTLLTLQFLADGPQYIELFSDNIESFVLDGRYFKYINRTRFPGRHRLESKYYEVLLENDSVLLVKNWQKMNKSKSGDNYAVFAEVSSLLFVKNGELHKITSKNDFFKLFNQDEIAKMESYAISHRYSFKENIEKEVADILAYYYK